MAKGNVTKHRFDAGDRDEWLQLRNSMTDKVGGSTLGALAGHSKYSTYLKEIEYSVGLKKRPDISDKIAIILGHANEPVCADMFEKVSGKKVHNENCIFTNDAYPHLKASIDRKIANEESGLECKTSFGYAMDQFAEGEFPPAYLDQTCCYLAVTKNKRWYLAILTGYTFKVFLMTTIKEEADRYNELRKRFKYPTEAVNEEDADYLEWKRDWAYLEAVYYVDEETLDGCETIAAKFISNVDEINGYMKDKVFATDEERRSFLQNAIFQVVDPELVTEIDAKNGAIGDLASGSPEEEIVIAEGSDNEAFLKEKVATLEDLKAQKKAIEGEVDKVEAEIELKVASLNAETVKFGDKKIVYTPSVGRRTASVDVVESYFTAQQMSVPEGLITVSVPKKPMTMKISANKPKKGKKAA